MGWRLGHPVKSSGRFVSIHATRVGWRRSQRGSLNDLTLFQSTPPAWGGDSKVCADGVEHKFQSTPPAWGGDLYPSAHIFHSKFQSTPPAWGGDCRALRDHIDHQFQSTPPAWGGDDRRCRGRRCQGCFNPRHPRGVATELNGMSYSDGVFQSTPPAWGGDAILEKNSPACGVSIHATRVGWRRRSFHSLAPS